MEYYEIKDMKKYSTIMGVEGPSHQQLFPRIRGNTPEEAITNLKYQIFRGLNIRCREEKGEIKFKESIGGEPLNPIDIIRGTAAWDARWTYKIYKITEEEV